MANDNYISPIISVNSEGTIPVCDFNVSKVCFPNSKIAFVGELNIKVDHVFRRTVKGSSIGMNI
jgi:hypothetical protein